MREGASERQPAHATHASGANETIRSLERASACEHAPWRAAHECSRRGQGWRIHGGVEDTTLAWGASNEEGKVTILCAHL